MIKLSIIIPVYNVELFVEKCIRSCVEQDIPSTDYEILIINDGTKDNSLEICERLASEFTNIHIVSQENQGLSSARNKGITLASGEYIWFVDSDDWIEKNCLSEITSMLFGQNLDALLISAANVKNERTIRRSSRPELEGRVYSGIDLMKIKKWEYCAPFTIYKKSFLAKHGLTFMLGVFHEDFEFTPRAYYFAQRVSILDKIIYHVYQNPNSITRSVNPKRAFDYILVAKSLSIFVKSVPDELKFIFNNLISIAVNNAFYILNTNSDKETEKKLSAFVYEHRALFNNMMRSSIMKNRIEGILLKLFPNRGIQVYRSIMCFRKKVNN